MGFVFLTFALLTGTLTQSSKMAEFFVTNYFHLRVWQRMSLLAQMVFAAAGHELMIIHKQNKVSHKYDF